MSEMFSKSEYKVELSCHEQALTSSKFILTFALFQVKLSSENSVDREVQFHSQHRAQLGRCVADVASNP